MAYLNPTSAQKEALYQNQTFKNEVKWALLTTANYWKNHDGAGLATAADREMWFKNRTIGVDLLLNPVGLITDQDYNLAANFSGNYLIVDDGGFNVDATIAYMITQNYFASISDAIFAFKVQNVRF